MANPVNQKKPDFKNSSFLSYMLNGVPTPSPCTFLGISAKPGNPYIGI